MKKISVGGAQKSAPQKPVKEKKQSSGGLFGGLFGGKPKPKQPLDHETDYEEQDEQEEFVEAPKLKPKPKSKLKAPVKPTQKQEKVNQDIEVDKVYYDDVESEEIYNQEEMDQLLFLYAAPSPFVRIQKYYNSKEGFTVLGTSNIALLEDEFSKKLNSRSILLFVTEESEIEPIKAFISKLIGIKSTNENLFEIYMVIEKALSVAPFKAVKGIGMVKVMPVVLQDGIKESMLDKVIARIVENQPSYVQDPEKIERPSVAKKQKQLSVETPFAPVDVDGIRAKLENLRKMSPEDKMKMMTSVQSSILNATSKEDLKKIESAVPQLRELGEIKEKLSSYIEDVIAGGAPVEEVEELALTSMEVTSIQITEMKAIINEVLRISQKQIEIEDKKIRDFQEDLLEELEANKENLDKLLSKREEMKAKVTNKLKVYKQKVVLSSNAIQLCNEHYKGLSQEVTGLVEKTAPALDEEGEEVLESSGALIMTSINESMKEYNKMKDDIQGQLTGIVNYVSSILKDYQILVKYDDIIIDNLLEEREMLMKNHIQKVIKVDNILKERGKLVYVSSDAEFLPIYPDLIDNDMLTITCMDDVVFDGVKEQDFNDFLNTEWTPRDSVNVIRFKEEDVYGGEYTQWESFINKLNYIIKYYKRIVVLLPLDVSKIIEEGFLSHVVDGVIVTSTDNDQLLKCNSKLNNLKESGYYSLRLLVNKNGEINFSDRIKEIRTLANIGPDVTESIFDSEFVDRENLKYIIKTL